MNRRLPVLLTGAVWCASAVWSVPQAASPQGAPAVQSAPDQAAVLKQYCITCHNERATTAGLMLDKALSTSVSADAEIWEKVVRKLRGGTMPPQALPGRPTRRSTPRPPAGAGRFRNVAVPAARSSLLLRHSGDPERKRRWALRASWRRSFVDAGLAHTGPSRRSR